MAKLSNNAKDNERNNFGLDQDTNVARYVIDSAAHTKLDAILGALGGSANTTTTIYNIAVPTADTEVSQALPANTKQFKIRNRGKAKIQLAYTSGQSGTNFITIMPGNVYVNDNFYQNQTLYFQCPQGSQTIEIEAHS